MYLYVSSGYSQETDVKHTKEFQDVEGVSPHVTEFLVLE